METFLAIVFAFLVGLILGKMVFDQKKGIFKEKRTSLDVLDDPLFAAMRESYKAAIKLERAQTEYWKFVANNQRSK